MASMDDCVESKIAKLIDEGKDRDQATAMAHSMCEDENKKKDVHDIKLQAFRDFNAWMDRLDEMVDSIPDDPAPAAPAEAPHEHVDDATQTGYIAPDSNAPGMLKALAQKFTRGLKPGQAVIKSADDKRLMLIVTSNSYEDREQETITSSALKSDVDRHWTADGTYMSNNPLLYWHDDDIVLGDIVWGDMVGPFYVELAREGDGVISKRYFDWRESHPDEKWGASHRFAYFTPDRQSNGDYSRIFKQETTTLPLDAAANLITLSEVIPMSDNRAKKFDEIMGLEGAYDTFKKDGLDKLVAQLQAQGVEHKSVDTPDSEPGNAFVQMIVNMAEDLSTLAADVDELSSKQQDQDKAFNTNTQALVDAVANVNALAEKLQERIDAKPRIASRAAETVTTESTLPADVNDLLYVNDPVFGKVKPVQE